MSEKVEVIAELKDLISGKFKEINSQIDAMDGKLSKINGGSGKGIMGSVLGANLLTGAISRAGSAALQFGVDSARAFGEQEQFQVALKTLLMGNTEQANALNNQLKNFALETPFELTEIQKSTQLLIAYGSSAGNVVDEMRMLGDVASGTSQPLNEIAYLYGTVRTQQKANLIDLRQFANRGIPIFKELAKVTKYTLQQLVEGGKDVDITFTDVEKAFKNMAAAGGQFHNMMSEQAKTLLGQTSNLSDAWEQLKVSIGKSQEGILKSTVFWATNMVTQLREVVDLSNYKDSALGALNKKYSIGFFDNDRRDNRYIVDLKNKERHEFKTAEEAQAFKEKNPGNVEASYLSNTQGIFDDFSRSLMNRVSKLKPEDAPAMINEITQLKRDILSKSATGEMSNKLAISELSTLSQAMKDIKGIKSLDQSKKDSQKAQEPAKLETLAKQNRAVQLIVNIENLVRENSITVNSPQEAKAFSAEEVSKVLIGAVNDFEVAAGQGS